MPSRLVIGSRGSRLALWQAEWARGALHEREPKLDIEVEVIRTEGDRNLGVPFTHLGGKGVFTKEIEEALLAGRIDLAVHSLKDLPTELPPGLEIGAVPVRADVRDALVSRDGSCLDGLPRGSSVGTSSLRRQALLLHLRPDLRPVGIRGNVDTRLEQLELEDLAAVILAAAGLERMALSQRVSEFLLAERFLPAPGQGALAIEVRCGDTPVVERIRELEHGETRSAVTAERAALGALGGGCRVPIGVWARMEGRRLVVDGMVGQPDGSRLVRGRGEGDPGKPEDLGRKLADDLIAVGAEDILDAVR